MRRLRAERDQAVVLVKKMKDCFERFKKKMDTGRRVQATIDAQRANQYQDTDQNESMGERSHSNVSIRSVNSIRSQRYVKLKVKQVKTNTDKESTIASLQELNS